MSGTDRREPGDRIVFVNSSGETLGDYAADDLAIVLDAFVVGLLDHCRDKRTVTDLIAGLCLVEDVPAELLLTSALRVLVVDVIATLSTQPETAAYFRAVTDHVRTRPHTDSNGHG